MMVRIVFVGDVDSGKSTLLGRLLFETDSISKEAKEEFRKTSETLGKDIEFAYLLDSFEEERQGELTIDTTQAVLRTQDKEYLLIDVPGHREFIKNMLTGASYANFAIVLCDAGKALEEQMKRHAFVLKFLGINEFILAINKLDSFFYKEEYFEKVRAEVMKFLKQIELIPVFVIPISAKEGDNLLKKSSRMAWYTGLSILEAMENLEIQEAEFQDFRFSIQDIYPYKREQVVVGTIASGAVKKGDKVVIAPLNLGAKIKKIIVFDKGKLDAKSRESIGLLLDRKNGIKRGQILYKGRSPCVTTQFMAKIFCTQQISENDVFNLKCSTQGVSCYITQINKSIDTATLEIRLSHKVLNEMSAAEVVIKTAEPIVIERFKDLSILGRFIIDKDGQIFAAGIIID